MTEPLDSTGSAEAEFDRIVDRGIETEMRSAFIDYSMSVIVSRALPDVRDGLKPVHRRILYAMNELGLSPSRPFKKSANVVGEVLGKYHPHGDSAVYDALVRMVQDFSLRYPLIQGQGNFGSIDGDNAAAYRYTEAKLAHAAMEMLKDIDRDTVDFTLTFDDQRTEPTVLPTRLPNLLINGSTGIAVGMATNIPPHNLRDVVQACIHLIDHPDCTIHDLIGLVQAPDFPTGGVICGMEGVREAYLTGRGRVVVRARAEIEEREDGRQRIVVREIPYMVNKERLVMQIAALVNEKRVVDVADLRDESDRDGIRVVIELKRDAVPYIVLNQLFKHSQLQTTFAVNMVALVNGAPQTLTLKDVLQHFISHRHTIVIRRAEHDLAGAKKREHILEGLKIAVDNIDEVIRIIRGSASSEQADERLRERFALSAEQSKAILEMRLSKLTGLEITQLEEELALVRASIADLTDILAREERRFQIIRDELLEAADSYADERRTTVNEAEGEFTLADLVPDEDNVVTISRGGYIKRLNVATYREQRRGGRGMQGMETKEDDFVEHMFLARTHDTLLCFTVDGHCHKLRVYDIPPGSRKSRGRPIVNVLSVDASVRLAALLPVREFEGTDNLVFVTRQGTFKKTPLSAYANIRSNGLIAIAIDEGDELIDVRRTGGSDEILLATREGIAIRFHEGDIRQTGRATKGVRGIRLADGDQIVGIVVPSEAPTMLIVTENGLGKRTAVEEYRLQGRGGRGVINMRVTEKTGPVIAVRGVRDDDALIVVTKNGVIMRQDAGSVPVIGRNTQGVKLITLDENDAVMDVAIVAGEDEEDEVASDELETVGGLEASAADADVDPTADILSV